MRSVARANLLKVQQYNETLQRKEQETRLEVAEMSKRRELIVAKYAQEMD